MAGLFKQIGLFSLFGFLLDSLWLETEFFKRQPGELNQDLHGAHEIHAAPTLNEVNRVPTRLTAGITTPALMAGGIGVHAERCGVVTLVQRTDAAQFIAAVMEFCSSSFRQFLQFDPGQ